MAVQTAYIFGVKYDLGTFARAKWSGSEKIGKQLMIY